MKAQPFQPFSLRLADGTEYFVKHPDYISMPPARRPREVFYFRFTNGGSEEYQTHRIDLGLVSEVIFPTIAAPGPTRDNES